MSLIWSLSGVISYKNDTSANFTVLKDRYQYFQEGPDVSALPEIVALMTDLGLPTKTAVVDPNITDLEFRFSVLDAETNNTTIEVGGASGGYRIRDNNYETTIAALTEDANFTQSFGTSEPVGPNVEDILIAGLSDPYVFDINWTLNNELITTIEYKINNGSWSLLAVLDPGIGNTQTDATSIMTLGDTLHLRLKFGAGSWSEASISPHALFVGTSTPNLNNFNYVLYGENPAPVLTLYDNNVVIDHPEYVVQFIGNANYLGRFNFSACVNITSIDIPNPVYVSGGVQVTGCANLIFCRARGSAVAVPAMDFTGCVNLQALKLPRIGLTDIDFLDTIPNKAMLVQLDLSQNTQLATADLTDFANLVSISMGGCTTLESTTLNSSELREITLSSCYALTTLDLSCSSIYNVINVSFSYTLQEITLSEGTANDQIGLYSLGYCAFSGESLDQFFNALGEGTGFKKKKGKGPTPPSIQIQSNPGSLECDISIATNKGWAVFTG